MHHCHDTSYNYASGGGGKKLKGQTGENPHVIRVAQKIKGHLVIVSAIVFRYILMQLVLMFIINNVCTF